MHQAHFARPLLAAPFIMMGLLLPTVPTAGAVIYTSDFGFALGTAEEPATPVAGQTVIGDVTVTLSSTHTEPNGTKFFRDTIPGSDTATVRIQFSQAINEFELAFASVLNTETVQGFNLGVADEITGSLVHRGGGVYSTDATDDSGNGVLRFRNFHADAVSWSVTGPDNTAIDFTGFGFSTPEPTTAASLGFFSVTLLTRRRWAA